MTTPAGLAEQAQEFGQEMTELLLATLPGLPVPPIEILQTGDRVIIRSPSPDLLPLYARRQRIAGMRVSVACQMDTTGQYLAVEESTYDLFAEVDRALEDFIQFLVCECLLDAEAGWRAHVDAGRERWRLRQAAVVARDAPEVAARVLRGLDYTVEAPDPIPAAQAKALRNW
jgi:hypothetical protein